MESHKNHVPNHQPGKKKNMLGVHGKITRIYCRGKVNMLINIDQPWVFGRSNCVIVQNSRTTLDGVVPKVTNSAGLLVASFTTLCTQYTM
jgi:hypothetical protein